ncbi:hypothetical protein Ciccas_001751 [Cichlidogyrus casuarinus]|uniref:Major facilitator superfamily (MFS) profile domain-containing protein n=1 Tax=Cichlidogyrus casuarinus TaxID=1844966 RepID=A0ABD2QJ53_9PLAT
MLSGRQYDCLSPVGSDRTGGIIDSTSEDEEKCVSEPGRVSIRRAALSQELHLRKICCCSPGTKRYVIAFLCSLCLTVVIGMRTEMYGIIRDIHRSIQKLNSSQVDKNAKKVMFEQPEVRGQLPWDGNKAEDFLVDCLENALFFAYIIGSPIGGFLTVRHDSSFLLGCSVAMTCSVNLFLPLAATFSQDLYTYAGIVIFLRLLQGLAEGCLIPAVFGVLRFWSPGAERSTLVCLAVIGVSFGPLIGLPICTYIEQKWGFGQVVFYIYANMGLIWCVFWWRLVDEKPMQDKSLSSDERLYLESNLSSCRMDKKKQSRVIIPWTKIFTSKPVFAILLTYAADDWTFQISSVCMQTFYKQIYDAEDSKIFTYLSIPFLSRSLFVPLGESRFASFSKWLFVLLKLSTVSK